MADASYLDALTNALRTASDYRKGLGETLTTLGSGMAAQVPAGWGGLVELARTGDPEAAANKANELADMYTYEPRTDIGQRAVENVGKGIQTVTDPLMRYTVDPIGERSPATGAAILAGLNLIGPKGAKAPKVRPHVHPELQAHIDSLAQQAESRAAARYDPGSPQQLIPGIDPLTLEEAHNRAVQQLGEAERGMHFEDMNRGLRFQYDPDWRGSAFGASQMQPGAYDFGRIRSEGDRQVGKREPAGIREGYIFRRDLEEQRASPMVDTSGDLITGRSDRARVGAENFQQMLERLERLRAAEGEATARGEEFALTRAREMNERIRRNRALLAEPGIAPEERLRLNEDILSAMRQRPFEVGMDEGPRAQMLAIPRPDPHANLHGAVEWSDLHGHGLELSHAELAPLMEQSALVRRLRGEPEPPPVRRPVVQQEPLAEVEGRDPNAMTREAVDAFLTGARVKPELFQHGALMPPANVRSLDDFAEYFSRKSGMPIDVDWSYAENPDEPYKIEQKKEHGRGEVMRDRYGDYKLETYDPGEKMYEPDSGDLKTKTKEVELVGPPEDPNALGLYGEKEVPKRAEGGEARIDESGEYVYQKSRGGEPMRDERGRIKYEKVENPDYQSGGEYDQAELRSPHGYITIDYGDPASITATQAGKKGGQTLYQVALAHAARQGIEIGGGGLTDINSYRLLGNTLSNIARSGVNPRDLAGTSSGAASRARGFAKGPEVWRADAEEARSRLLESGTDPDRVRFDPEKGFSIDGEAATPANIEERLDELSPRAKSRGSSGGVGQKSLMRNAVFEWLRHATPEQAKEVAAKWPKEWGPIFAGVAGLSVAAGALQEKGD